MDPTIKHAEQPVTGDLSDNDIIARVITGEKNLYAVIMRRYNQRLYRVAFSMVNDDAEAEDIMQVTYIKAYEHLNQFEFKAGFGTWLTRILINESLLRLKKRAYPVPLTDTMIDNPDHTSSIEKVQTPFSSTVNHELRDVLEGAILSLPEKYRTVFVMREMEGMNVVETGECLGLTEINVKVRLNRAKAMLRSALYGIYKKDEIMHFYLTRCNRMVEQVMKHIQVE